MNELIGVITPDNTYNISGEVSGESTLSGVVTGGAQYEAYSGSYSVTPSGSVQTLETDGKLMTDDVTVAAIPSDYIGTDIPRRSSISVSQDNNTIHVEDGYYENDIDTSMGACTVTGASVSIDSQGDATGAIIVGRGGYINSGSHAFYVDDVVTPRSSSDLTASGATVSVPYGYYSADASKTVASGSAGTPTATKGTVSNHAVNVTPSVTNTTGYITGGTVTGTAVSVSASELVSGNKAITENGTGIDVANYSTVSVDVQSGSTVSVVDTTDSGGGTVRTITASGTTIPTPASDISKLILNGVTQMDVTDTTATVSDVASGKVFTQVDGTTGTGTASGGGDNAYKFIDNSFSGEYVNNLISSIRNYALNFHTGHDFSFSSSSATSIGYNAFQSANITSFSAPNLTGAANNASTFNSAKKLTFADMGSLTKIYGNFAWNANALAVLVLRHTSVVVLDNVNAFGNTPIRGYSGLSGTIYVPENLVESYKTASNWSSIFNEGHVTFTAIEGSIYE